MKQLLLGGYVVVMLALYFGAGYYAVVSASDHDWVQASFWVLVLIWINTVKIGESK